MLSLNDEGGALILNLLENYLQVGQELMACLMPCHGSLRFLSSNHLNS